MLYLNPSLKKNLVVVKESKQIFYNMIGLIHKNVNDKILANYNGFIDKESGNRKLIEMFKIVEIFNVYDSSFDELKELEDFYDNYLKLVKKTGG